MEPQPAHNAPTDSATDPGGDKPAAAKPLEDTDLFSQDGPDTDNAGTKPLAEDVGPTNGGTQRIVDDTARAADTAAAPAAEKMKIAKLGDFQLIKKLGRGGMGTVFLARQLGLDRDVAIKVLAKHLADDSTLVQRFQREARLMAKLDHPHILNCFAVGEDHGFHYLAMEYAENGSLTGWLKKEGKLNLGDALHIILAAADALQHAHELNLIHRDIKPDNILITKKGIVKVADLGLAKAMSDDLALTRSGMGAGTPVYMSPEQTRDAKHVDGRSDIYSLGCMLYRCLAGKPPFEGETYVEILEAKEKGRYTPVSKLHEQSPARLDTIIGKALAKDAKDRYQTCADLIRDLELLEAANPALSFLGGSVRPITPRTLTSHSLTPRSMPSVPATPSMPTVEAPGGWWYIRCLNVEGIRKMTEQEVLKLMSRENFDLRAEVSRSPTSGFRPIGAYPTFEKAFRGRIADNKARQKSAKYSEKFQEIVKEQERYERQRRINNFLRRVGGWLILALVLGGIGAGVYYGYKALKPKIAALAPPAE